VYNISYCVWLQNTGIYMSYQVNLQNPEDDKQDPYHKIQGSHSNATDDSFLQAHDSVIDWVDPNVSKEHNAFTFKSQEVQGSPSWTPRLWR
jgi:hypothetical protein